MDGITSADRFPTANPPSAAIIGFAYARETRFDTQQAIGQPGQMSINQPHWLIRRLHLTLSGKSAFIGATTMNWGGLDGLGIVVTIALNGGTIAPGNSPATETAVGHPSRSRSIRLHP